MSLRRNVCGGGSHHEQVELTNPSQLTKRVYESATRTDSNLMYVVWHKNPQGIDRQISHTPQVLHNAE